MIVRWSKDWEDACPDSCIDEWFATELEYREEGCDEIMVATCAQLSKVRLENLLGNIKVTQFIHEGEEIPLSKFGDVGAWPVGFGDAALTLTLKVLKQTSVIRKRFKRTGRLD